MTVSFKTYIGQSHMLWISELSEETTDVKQAVRSKLTHFINAKEFEEYRIRQVLITLRDKTAGFIEALYKSYDLYADGYFFMETVGVQHGLTFSNTYFDYYEWKKLPESDKKASISKIYPSVKIEAERVLIWLDNGTIKLTGIKDREGLYTFHDSRSDFDRLQSFGDFKVNSKKPRWSSLFSKAKQQLKQMPILRK